MADPAAALKQQEILKKAISTPSSRKLFSRVAVAVCQQNSSIGQFLASQSLDDDSILNSGSAESRRMIDGRCLPRRPKIVYDHEEIKRRLYKDYLGPYPIFEGREFDTMFRISKSRFQRIMEDIAATGDPFYLNNVDAFGKVGASFEAKLLLPLKSMAYGVPPHTFRDYFYMSTPLARRCCYHFDHVIRKVYTNEYLRCPDATDLKNINTLHKTVHSFEGLFGSLDCMHTYWKNCPLAWQGSYKGKEKKPSIVLEAISDFHMWFWHAAYGYAGCMNDISILAVSPFLERLLDGTFQELESCVVPYHVGETILNQMYILVDGIYPAYSRLVKGYKEPVTNQEKAFTAWQESVRKDIERAFGVLKGKWQCMERPFKHIDLPNIAARVATCLILHNMCVSDRVMEGDVHARYDPSNSVTAGTSIIHYPRDLHSIQGRTDEIERAEVGIRNLGGSAKDLVTRKDRWNFLKDREKTASLHKALIAQFH